MITLAFITLNAPYISLVAQPADAIFTNLGPGEGLPVTTVTDVVQDAFGLIWIGSWDGVYTYDGKHFEKKAASGRFLKADTKGGMWISAEGGSVIYYNSFVDSLKEYTIPVKERFAFIETDVLGNVWASTNEGIFRLDTLTDQFDKEKGQLDGAAFQLKASADGKLTFLHYTEGEVLRIGTRDRDGKYSYEEVPDDFNDPLRNQLSAKYQKWYTYLFPYDTSGLLLVNKNGWVFRKNNDVAWKYGKRSDQQDLGEFDGAVLDERGNIWLNQVDSLTRVNIQTAEFIVYKNDLTDPNSILTLNTVHVGIRLFIDRQGILWVPRFTAGISRLNLYETDFSLLKDTKGKRLRDALSVYEDHDSSFWVGSRLESQGLIHYSKKGDVIEFFRNDPGCPPGKSTGQGLSDRFVWTVARSEDGSIWAGTGTPVAEQGGLNRIRPGSKDITRFKNDPGDPSSIPSNSIFKVVVDGSDRLWISYREGLCWINPETEVFTKFGNGDLDPALPQNDQSVIRVEMTTADGDVIVRIHDKDHYLIDHNTLTSKPFGPEYTKMYVKWYNFQDPSGKIWFINDKGFGYLDAANENVANFYDLIKNNIPANQVYQINSNQSGTIWLASDNGILSFDPANGNYRHFGYNRGLQGNLFDYLNTNKGPSGKIYFGGNGGLNVIDPDKISINPFPPEMVFTGIKLDENDISFHDNASLSLPLAVADKIVIGPEISVISVDFSAIHFAGFEDNSYQFMLEGFDKDWRDGGKSGNATYTNLTNGHYTLYIKGSNWDGVWSDGNKSLEIIILPPWYKTWWAYGIYVILLAAAIFLFDKYRKRRLLEKERAVAKEKELAQAKEIEKAYEELKSTQTQLIHSEKMASLGELTAGIAHEIQNPLNFVNNFSEVSVELVDELDENIEKGDKSEAMAISGDLRQNLEKINHHGKRADAIVKSMLQHSRSSKGQKELTDINVLADEYLRLAYHGMRAKDKSFNADFRLDTDKELPLVKIVPQDIGRVLLNLINNAFYAVSEKARRDIPGYRPEVVVNTRKIENNIELRVVDNGDGVPEDIREKIFQPFFTTKPTGQGTGLGLSMSYDIITKGHNGTLNVGSTKDEGTVFTIKIPIAYTT